MALGPFLCVKRARTVSHTSVMCTARLCKVQKFTVAEVIFTKMCNCYFGERKSRLPFCTLRPHDVIYQRGADTPKNKWLLGILRCIYTGAFHSSRDVGVCHARLSVACGRRVETASNMFCFFQPTEIKVEPSELHVHQKLYLDVVAQVICKLAKVVNVSGPCLRLLSQRVSEDLRI